MMPDHNISYELFRLLHNAKRVLSDPKTAGLFVKWLVTQMFLGRPPYAHCGNSVLVGGFANFSEFLSRRKCLDRQAAHVLGYVAATARGGVAIDVGANLGFFSLEMARLGFSKILSLEPIPETFMRFSNNCKINPVHEEKKMHHQTLLMLVHISWNPKFLIT